MIKRGHINILVPSTVLLGSLLCMFIFNAFYLKGIEFWNFSLFLLTTTTSGFIIRSHMQKDETKWKLEQSQESLKFALQSGRMGTWDIDLKNNTVNCSKEMLDIWGITRQEFTGNRKILQSKVHPDDLEKMNAAINGAILNGKIYELEYRIHPSSGLERWVFSRGRCTFDPETRKAVRFSGVVFDITDAKEVLKVREQFFAIAGHELKTPLTCLQLQNQVAQWDLENNFPAAFTKDKIESGLQRQNDQLLRLTRIVDNILDESKISEGRLSLQLEYFNLAEMVSDVLDRFKTMIDSSGVEIKFSNSYEVFGVWDRFRIEQVFLNLLINAIRYGNKKPIEIEVFKENKFAALKVRDNGIGIKEDDHARIFERFQRLAPEKDKSGMGLGLFISNNIVVAHGGEIRVKSESLKGSEFSVLLPIENAPG